MTEKASSNGLVIEKEMNCFVWGRFRVGFFFLNPLLSHLLDMPIVKVTVGGYIFLC